VLTHIAGDLRARIDFAVLWFHEKCELDPNSLMDRPSSFSPTMRPEPSRFWKLYATPLMQFPTPSIGREISCKASDASRREVANVCLASLRAQRSNPWSQQKKMDCFVASLLAMTGAGGNSLNANSPPHTQPSSPANGSAEWPPDDRLRRAIQYSEAPVIESRSCGVLDTPLSRSMTVSGGARRRLAMTGAGGNSLNANAPPHTQPSSPAKAGDPVFRGASDRIEKLQRTGYSAFAEYDGFWGSEATKRERW
jgi:hypothetical protein